MHGKCTCAEVVVHAYRLERLHSTLIQDGSLTDPAACGHRKSLEAGPQNRVCEPAMALEFEAQSSDGTEKKAAEIMMAAVPCEGSGNIAPRAEVSMTAENSACV